MFSLSTHIPHTQIQCFLWDLPLGTQQVVLGLGTVVYSRLSIEITGERQQGSSALVHAACSAAAVIYALNLAHLLLLPIAAVPWPACQPFYPITSFPQFTFTSRKAIMPQTDSSGMFPVGSRRCSSVTTVVSGRGGATGGLAQILANCAATEECTAVVLDPTSLPGSTAETACMIMVPPKDTV